MLLIFLLGLLVPIPQGAMARDRGMEGNCLIMIFTLIFVVLVSPFWQKWLCFDTGHALNCLCI